MKKLKCFLVIGLLVILTTGCVKFNANMDIKKDKSMDFSIIYALDKTVFGDANKLKEEDFKDATEEGFTVKKYTEGNYEGFTLTKKIKNIDEVSTESDTEYSLSGMMSNDNSNKYLFKVVKGEKTNTYYAKFKFDANDSGLNGTDEEETLPDETDALTTTGEDDGNDLNMDDVDLSKMMGSMDLSFSVTLPYGATKNNATKAEDNNKKLTWTLSSTNQEYIEFEFELNNNETNGINMMYVYIGIGVLLLAVIIVLIVTMSKKKNDNPQVVSETKEENTNKE